MRFIERVHKSEGIENILSNPITFFCSILKEDPKSGLLFDGTHFSKMLVKNNILKKRINPKLTFPIKGTCFLIFPKDGKVLITSDLIKWMGNLGINLLFVKCGIRYYSSLISPIIGRKGKDNLTIVIQTVTVLLGRVNIIVGKINGVICRAFKALSLQKI
jgi:hypothetical protein